MNLQVIKNRILYGVKKFILYTLYMILFFFLVGFGIVQIPAVQKPILKHFTDQFSALSGFNISFKSVELIWYDRFQIRGLEITDPENNLMVQSELASINYRITSILNNNQINLDAAVLNKTQVNLIKIAETDSTRNLNINVLINRLSKPRSGKSGQSTKVNIGEIILDQSQFSLIDPEKDSLVNQFDYNHFSLDIENGQFQNFKVIGDTIQFNVNSLAVTDQKSNFKVKQLSTFFRISQSSMEFLNVKLDAGNSHIEDTVIFTYKSQLDLNDFNNRVTIKAKLKNTTIDPADLARFIPAMQYLKENITVAGTMTGKLSNFNFREMELGIGSSKLFGQVAMDGLPYINETFINLKLNSSTVDINDLKFALPGESFKRLQPLDKFLLRGNFTGFINDFVADGYFKGNFGEIDSDLNLKIDESDVTLSRYKGNIQLKSFRLGQYLNDTLSFQNVSMKGKIDGSGFTTETADFNLNGTISKLGLRNYEYQNIITNAQFKAEFFNGTLVIDDPNLKLNAEGSIDFRKDHELVKIKAKLDTLFLDKLGIVEKNFFLRSELEIDSKGLQVDSVLGNARFNNTLINYQSDSLEIDSIRVISSRQEDVRNLYLRSSLMDVDLSGDYYYSTLFKDLQSLFTEFYLTIKNDKEELDQYYLTKARGDQEYDAKFDIKLHDINPLIKVAGLDLIVSKEVTVKGRFSNGFTSIVNAYSQIDSITYGGKLFTQNELDFNGSKIRDSTNILAMLSIYSNEQFISKNFKSKDLIVDAIWDRTHIEVGLDFDQVGFENAVRLKSAVDFMNDSTRVKLLPSEIKILNESWSVNNQNYIIYHDNVWDIHNLDFTNVDQSVRLHGEISPDPSKLLQLNINRLELDILNSISEDQFAGILNGSLQAKGIYDSLYIQNDIEIKDLTINEFLVGDILGVNKWNQEEKRFDINFTVDRLNFRTVSLTGHYEPGHINPLAIKARFDKANLKTAEPILKDLFSELGGTLTGEYDITGSFAQPHIAGSGLIENGQIMINYLKTKYNFTGNLGLQPNQIDFQNFRLTDIFNNTGSLEGFIAHRNFREFRINLDGSFTNFQLLNTTAKDNSLFYGQGYATGNVNILGPSSRLKISATARSEKNTRVYIPMSASGDVERKDFVNFVHFTDTAQINRNPDLNQTKKRTEASGIAMDLNLDITPDAYAEIIFDIKSGDIIRGRGNGDIKLQIDTKGEFSMFGSVEFTQGAYNFTLYDIINKEFDIQPGSRISWYGNPYEGVMDITAVYNQMASLAPILSDQTIANDPQIRRKYPTEVQLNLDGQMLSPQINFDIEANELPDNIVVEGRPPVRLDFEFQAFKSKLDEQELKRQVFSLIILRRFSPPDAFSTSGTLYNSVSELLSNQLSYWLTQVDQNLEIDLDLGTLDQEAFNTFQLRLSYSFLNGRLRVTRDGAISNQYNTSDNISSIAGDWTVDYLLTQDGKFKVKMYSRSNFNQLSSTLTNGNAVTTGVSLLHTQNFNELKDLLKFAKDEAKNEKPEKPNPEEEAIKEDEDDG
ncbi:MAG: translocation/assembly module TamB domain-containing protein [Cyclobacteriaceae bacterium]